LLKYTNEKFTATDEQAVCPCQQSGRWYVSFYSPDGAASAVSMTVILQDCKRSSIIVMYFRL